MLISVNDTHTHTHGNTHNPSHAHSRTHTHGHTQRAENSPDWCPSSVPRTHVEAPPLN